MTTDPTQPTAKHPRAEHPPPGAAASAHAATWGGGAAFPATARRARASRPAAWPVAAGTAGAFLAAIAFLAGQVREGRDPALGPAEPAAAAAKPRAVVVRRVIRRVVIHHPAPRAATGGAAPAAAPAAPASAAPAPLTTRSS